VSFPAAPAFGVPTCAFAPYQSAVNHPAVPGWSDPKKPFRPFNGSLAYDGAFVQPLPCPPNVTYCLKVRARWMGESISCSFAASQPPLMCLPAAGKPANKPPPPPFVGHQNLSAIATPPPHTPHALPTQVLGVVPPEAKIYLQAFREHPEYFRSTWNTMRDFLGEARHSELASTMNVQFGGAAEVARLGLGMGAGS